MPPNYSEEVDPHGDAWSNIRKNPESINEWMRIYYAMTANLDWNVGRLLKTMEEVGIGDNTITLFTSDHGEMFGAHGRMKKNIFYDEAARVPFLMRWPGKIPAGHVSDACASTVDIMPTLLGLAGAEIPKEVEGMDLSHCALRTPGPEPEAALLQNTGACASWEDGHEWRAVRDKEYTYAVYRVDREEMLFHHKTDPYQMRNLAGDPESARELTRLRAMLKEKMASLGDTFEKSTWYRDHWIENRTILRGARQPNGSRS